MMMEPANTEDDFQGRTNPLGLLAVVGLFTLLWVEAGPRTFFVAVGLVMMIALHELGHFATAKWTGMKVTQFFLFMGPRLWSFKRGETEYGIRLLPIGAFVRIVGMNNLDPVAPEDSARAYRNKSYPKRMLVITAGSLMHFAQAIVLLVIVVSVIGTKTSANWSVRLADPHDEVQVAPATVAQLAPGDKIVAVNGAELSDWFDLTGYVGERPGGEITLTVTRDGDVFDRAVTLATVTDKETGQPRGYLGILPTLDRTRSSPIAALSMFGQGLSDTVAAIPQFFSPQTFGRLASLMLEGRANVSVESEEAQRPVSLIGATRIAGDSKLDVTGPLQILAMVNISVGVLNLLPLLPLDGGHAAIATYERLRSRAGRRYHADVAKMLPVAYAVIVLLGFMMVSTVYLDTVRPIV